MSADGLIMITALQRMATRIDYRLQVTRAHGLLDWHTGPISVWLVDYPLEPGRARRVSLTGGSIVDSMVDLWRIAGARCHLIRRVTRSGR